MKYQPDPLRDYDGTYNCKPALSIDKIRNDAKALKQNLAPYLEDPYRGDMVAVANLILNMADYFEAKYEHPRRDNSSTHPQD